MFMCINAGPLTIRHAGIIYVEIELDAWKVIVYICNEIMMHIKK